MINSSDHRGIELRWGRNEHLSRALNALSKRVDRQTEAQSNAGVHFKVACASYRASCTYLGGMPVFKYASIRLTSAREKTFFSVNRKGTLQASTMRRRAPILRKVKSVPLTWEYKNVFCCHLISITPEWPIFPAPSHCFLNPWIRLYFQDSNRIFHLLFFCQHGARVLIDFALAGLGLLDEMLWARCGSLLSTVQYDSCRWKAFIFF